MLESLFVSLTREVIAFALKEFGVVGKARAWLGRDPVQLAFQASLMAAFKAVQADYSDLESILFDEHFLNNGAGPILGRYLDGLPPPSAPELATAWADQLGPGTHDRDKVLVTRAAEAYLQAVERELGKHQEFEYIYKDRVLSTLVAIDQAVRTSPVGELRRVRDLVRSGFSLGDDEAANFCYLADPVRTCWEAAERYLRLAEQRSGQAGTLLILGAANSGKTRLAVEALMATLPEWYVLRWRPDYTPKQIPSDAQIGGLDLVIFADDLHEYVSRVRNDAEVQLAGTDPRAVTFQTLLERVRACTQRSVVVATCRDEREDDILAAMPHVVSQAQMVHIPTFEVAVENPTTRDIVEAFQMRGARYCAEWDGTLGSLVLGLAKKKAQYLALRASPAGTILRAMKLLAAARTSEHTKRRIQLVCDKVFGETQLASNPSLWDSAVDELTRTQFVLEDVRSIDGAPRLTLRKDIYLERVVADYPSSQRPTQLDQHFAQLRSALIAAGDANALSNLGVAYFDRQRLDDALATYSDVLTLDPAMAIAWLNKGNALYALNRLREALDASDTAIELDPRSAIAWSNHGAIFAGLGRHEDALAAFDRSLELDPTNEVSIINRCVLLIKLGRAREALPILESLRATQQSNATFWHTLGLALNQLSRWDEALSACDRALTLDPSNAGAVANKVAVLAELGRFDEALASSEMVEDGSPWAEVIWHNRGNVLRKLGDQEAAIAAFDHALEIRPKALITLMSKAATLVDLGRPGDALEVAALAIKTDPSSKEAWNNQGLCQLKLELPERALISFECATVLDRTYDAAWNNKGVALTKLKRVSDAAEAFRRACAINPANSAAAGNLEKAMAVLSKGGKSHLGTSTGSSYVSE